jgi:hypothetical protein
MATEIRKATAVDIEFGTGNATSVGGHVGAKVNATHLPVIIGSNLMTVNQALIDMIDIRSYLPVGHVTNGSVAYTSQVQAAVIAAENAGKTLYVPIMVGVDDEIILRGGSHLDMLGTKRTDSGFKALATMSKMFKTDGAQNTRPTYMNLSFYANGFADYSLYLPHTDHMFMFNCWVIGAKVFGLHFSEGWSNNIWASEFSFNSGGGINAEVSINQNTFIGNTIFGNDGVGLQVNGGTALLIEGNAFEANKKTGWIISGVNGVTLESNYYDTNGPNGLTLSDPSMTVHVSGILNGSPALDTMLARTYTNSGVNISGEYHNPRATDNAAYLFVAVDNVEVGPNSSNYGIPLIWIYNDLTYGLARNVHIAKQNGFSSDLVVTNSPVDGSFPQRLVKIDSVFPRNYMAGNFLTWSMIAGTAGGTFQRSSAEFNGFETFRLTGVPASAASDMFGLIFPFSDYPELAGKTIYLGAWVKCSDATTIARLFGKVSTTTGDSYTGTSWVWIGLTEVLPDTGSAYFGFNIIPTGTTVTVDIACPVLAVVGAHFNEFYKEPISPVWRKNAAPTVGSWPTGAIIWNTAGTITPMGWKCTAGGTPGTWAAFP